MSHTKICHGGPSRFAWAKERRWRERAAGAEHSWMDIVDKSHLTHRKGGVVWGIQSDSLVNGTDTGTVENGHCEAVVILEGDGPRRVVVAN